MNKLLFIFFDYSSKMSKMKAFDIWREFPTDTKKKEIELVVLIIFIMSASIGLKKIIPTITVDPSKCISCQNCVTICPSFVFKKSKDEKVKIEANPRSCIECLCLFFASFKEKRI